MNHQTPHNVVIIGGGFGGVRAALNLANISMFKVTLISDQTFFEYHAALYRSATGRSPLEVAIPLKEFFRNANNIEVVTDRVEDINVKDKKVSGQSGSVWHYDSLIAAVGSVTNFFGIKGLDKYSYGVKSIHQALELKRHLHDSLVAGHEEKNYVVIGAGATGVELSAELAAYLKRLHERHKLQTKYSIHLIEAADKVMPALPANFTKKLEKRLRRLGIKLHLGTSILSESYDGIELPGGKLQSHTVIWTAGMSINPLLSNDDEFKLTKRHKIEVDEHLKAAEDVYVIGDSADTKYSGMAQTALHDANFITEHLVRQQKGKRLIAYKPKKPIYAIPVGRRWSGVLWNGFKIYGRPGWMLRRLADLRLYLHFLPTLKALTLWRYGVVIEEDCTVCQG